MTGMLARVGCCALVFAASSAVLWAIIVLHPTHIQTDSSDSSSTGFPISFANWSSIGAHLSYCKQQHFTYIGTLFTLIYLYKQAFAIPGTLLLVGGSHGPI